MPHSMTLRALDGAPLPAPRPVGDPAEAVEILHHILAGDFIGRGPDGEVYVLMEIPGWMFNRLCAWGADAEDLEDTHDAELDEEGEPSLGAAERFSQLGWAERAPRHKGAADLEEQCEDEGCDTDREPDDGVDYAWLPFVPARHRHDARGRQSTVAAARIPAAADGPRRPRWPMGARYEREGRAMKTTRRDMLTGATAALAGAFLPIAAASAAADPVIPLCDEWLRLRARSAEAWRRAKEIRARIGEEVFHLPRVDMKHPAFKCTWFMRYDRVTRREIEQFNAHTISLSPMDLRRHEESAARLAWFDQQEAKNERIKDESGHSAAWDEFNALDTQLRELGDQIAETSAATLPGAILRLRVAVEMMHQEREENGATDLVDEEALTASACADLERLTTT